MFNFSKSTIVGLTLGVLLAGYAVFAFDPPSSAPSAGNVPAPLNTGSGDQTKTGGTLNVFGLWVNQSLGVTDGASFGGILDLGGNKITNVGSPSAAGDVATKGFVDTQTSNLQARISGSCAGGQGIRAIASNGSVTCETLPAGLQSGDLVAATSVAGRTSYMACNQPSDGGRSCYADWYYYYTWYPSVGASWNPRGVLTVSYPQLTTPCYEIPNGSSGSCGNRRTVNGSPSYSCSGGFTVDTGHPVARQYYTLCSYGIGNSCSAAVCRK